jgi:cobalamin transport system substrate-binding protein
MANKKVTIGIIAVVIILSSAVGGYFIYDNMTYETYTDSQNREVKIPDNPQRIVSMAPSITEMLFAIDADNKLVGRTDYCDYPIEAKNITSIGGFSTPDIEKLVAVNPDLILATSYDATAVGKLEAAGFVIYILEPGTTLLSIIEDVKTIGKIVNAEEKANAVAVNMTAKYNQIIGKTSNLTQSKLKVVFEIWESPMVVGKQSYLNDMIDKAGAINIFGNITGKYPTVSNENVIAGNPDVFFLTEHSAAWYTQSVCNRTGYNIITACSKYQIYSVDDNTFLRAGPRAIDALEIMVDLLYPSLL